MIDKIVRTLKKDKEIIAVYLFGSHGTPQQTPLSDIDLCVFTKKSTGTKMLQLKSFGSDTLDISVFHELSPHMKIEVFRGKPLFVRDKFFLAECFAEAFREYQDIKPYQDKYLSVLKKSLVA